MSEQILPNTEKLIIRMYFFFGEWQIYIKQKGHPLKKQGPKITRKAQLLLDGFYMLYFMTVSNNLIVCHLINLYRISLIS